MCCFGVDCRAFRDEQWESDVREIFDELAIKKILEQEHREVVEQHDIP